MKKTIITLSALGLCSMVQADWTILSDFESGADAWTVSTPVNSDASDLPRLIVVDDPLSSGQGQVAQVNPGTSTDGVMATSFSLPIPDPFVTDESLPIGEAQYYTLFYKIHHPLVDGTSGKTNTTIGTIDIDNSAADDVGFLTWPRYNMIFRDGGNGGSNFPAESNGLPLNSHNGATYFMPYAAAGETDSAGVRMDAADAHAQNDVWYCVWMVANMDDLTAEVYVSGGQFGSTPRLINIIGNYRNGAAVDHDTILMNTSTINTDFPHATHVDDFAIAKGKELTVPGGDVVPVVEGDLINIATRGKVGEGVNAMIAGFVVEGGTKSVLVQAVGTELIDDDPADALTAESVLADPTFLIVPAATAGDASTHIASNDWSGAEVVTAGAEVGATVLTAGSTSAAAVVDLEPGAYTVIVGGGTGVALVEIYDLD